MSFIDIVIIEPCFVQNWNVNPMLCKYVYSFPLAGHYFFNSRFVDFLYHFVNNGHFFQWY